MAKKKKIVRKRIAVYDAASPTVLTLLFLLDGGQREFIVNGYHVKVQSLRYRTFQKSPVCTGCQAVGTLWALERMSTDPPHRAHFELYTIKDGKELLMTKDHIIPKSRGGLDTLENLQTMCTICNQLKGNN